MVTRTPSKIAFVALSLAWSSGCVSQPASYGWHGERQVAAVYVNKTLHSELPGTIPPQSVRAAAERVLSARGYTLTASEATNDRTRVVARPPRRQLFRRVTIGSSFTASGTRVGVTIEPGGNETTARDILESMLTVLGH